MRRINKALRILLIAVLLAFIIPAYLGFYSLITMSIGEDRTFHNELYDAAERAGNVLVANNICKTVNESCAGTIYFATASSGGGHVAIYGISDKRILNDFSKPFIQKFFEITKMTKLIVTSYIPTKAESMKNFLSKDRINFQVKLERSE